jgi:hypothetical protein
MSIIAEAIKKREEGKVRQKPVLPSPHFDVPTLVPKKAPPETDLLPDRELQWLDSLSHWVRQVNPWMIWAGMGVSLVFATVFFLIQEARKTDFLNDEQPLASSATASKKPIQISNKELATPAKFRKASDYELTGISVIDGAGIAIVNNKVVRQGDWVDGARVLEIKPQEVVLEYRGQKLSRALY